jgi:hypothetical protein
MHPIAWFEIRGGDADRLAVLENGFALGDGAIGDLVTQRRLVLNRDCSARYPDRVARAQIASRHTDVILGIQ